MKSSARFYLKAATAVDHEELDALFSGFDLSERAGYAGFLTAQAGVFPAVETSLDRAGVHALVDDWPRRRRSQALLSDLGALGCPTPTAASTFLFSSPAEALGGLYVLEGSRLGGAMLVRQIADGLPKSFLSAGNPAAWRAFVELMDKRLSSPSDLEAAARAAQAVFAAFASSARTVLGADRS